MMEEKEMKTEKTKDTIKFLITWGAIGIGIGLVNWSIIFGNLLLLLMAFSL